MQNMQNIHSELAIQQRVDFSIGSGNQFGQDFLEREADSTSDRHEPVISVVALLPMFPDRVTIISELPSESVTTLVTSLI